MNCLEVPFLDGSWYGIHGHDALHEEGGYSGREISDEDIWIFDVGPSNMILEF